MFDTLFGAEMPLAVRFFLAFLIVLGLIGATAWAVRRFGAGRLGAGARGRQPRLAVIDYASVDGRRRLILVRRDNVEHLLMIGGPTDVVVEPNIVRAVAAPRDVPGARPTAGIEALPRALPLPENGANGSWPLQPEAAGGSRPAPRVESLRAEPLRAEPLRIEPLPDELPARSVQPQAETPPRPQRDTLAALADELSTRPTPPPPRSRTAAVQPQPEEAYQEPRQEFRQESRPRPEPRKPAMQPAPVMPATADAPAIPAAAEPASAADQSLADMAHRLENALRKSPAEARPPAPRAAPAPGPAAAPRPARPEAKPNQGKTTLYDSLEQEMASLLGRPPKT